MFLFFQKKIDEVRKLLHEARPELPRILLASLCMIVVAGATASYAYLVGPVIKSLFLKGVPGDLPLPDQTNLFQEITRQLGHASAPVIGIMIVVAASIKGIAFFFERILIIGAGQQILMDLRARLYRGILSLSPIGRDARAGGALVSRFTVDVETIEQAITKGLLAGLRDSLQVLALSLLAFSLSPTLALVGLVALPPIGLLISRISRSLRVRKGEVYDAFSRLGRQVEETAAGLPVIRTLGAEKVVEERFGQQSAALMTTHLRTLRIRAFSSPLNEIMGAAALALTLWYAHRQIEAQSLQPEEFISFFTALFLMYQPVKGLGNASHFVAEGLAALDRIEPIARLRRLPVEAPGTPLEDGGLEIRNLTCGYDPDLPVIENLSLSLGPGEKVALVGASGSGKSTLINAICGFLPAWKGTIRLPAVSGENPPVAPVFQEPFLFDDTLRNNALLGRKDVTKDAFALACDTAGATDFFGDLELGADTPAGPGGHALSVGQRQRICIARALLSRAPLILLDEVTASLDGETEQTLVAKLAARETERTILVVTHRLSTARWCDRVVLLDNGAIVLDGPPDILFKNDETLRRLFGTQSEEELVK